MHRLIGTFLPPLAASEPPVLSAHSKPPTRLAASYKASSHDPDGLQPRRHSSVNNVLAIGARHSHTIGTHAHGDDDNRFFINVTKIYKTFTGRQTY
ncbi:hypothetical protein F4604DRAFT_1941080 [Suillus subluteus]|nr:hypothetical protein F4604DRAFT_1941080 [Suillus subluteus]